MFTRTESLKGRNFGIGFGGSSRKDCKLWIDQDIGKNSFVGFKEPEESSECLMNSLDRFIRQLMADIGKHRETQQPTGTISSKTSDDKTMSLSRDENGSFPFWSTGKESVHPFHIEILGLEAWALTNTESFEAFKNKLIRISNFNHYDKMIGVNYDSGIKDAEMLIETSEYFTEKE